MVSNNHIRSVWLVIALLAAMPARAGDPRSGRQIVEDRALSACLLCHSGPFPAPHSQGNIGPSLEGAGDRFSPSQLRARLIDPAQFNPETVMPAYGNLRSLKRVGSAWRERPILSTEQIEDVVAFLATLHGP